MKAFNVGQNNSVASTSRMVIQKALLTDDDYIVLRRAYTAIKQFTNEKTEDIYRKTAPTTFALFEQAYSQGK